jgi:hypothetical protein
MADTETLAEDTEKRGLDRRTLIKRAAVAGAVAWAAPAIVGSVASPAGALSAPKGCFRFKFNTDPTSHGGAVCQVVSYASSSCEPSASSLCSPDSVTTLASGTSLSTYCITHNLGGSCNRLTSPATFTINAACSCTFLGGRFIASRIGGGVSGCPATICVTGSGVGTKTMSFAKPGDCSGAQYQWEQARIVFRCG